jgi:DNA-binding NtrC family response regulator
MRQAARDYLIDALQRARGSRTRAALLAGLNRTHFLALLKRYQLSAHDCAREVQSAGRPAPERPLDHTAH